MLLSSQCYGPSYIRAVTDENISAQSFSKRSLRLSCSAISLLNQQFSMKVGELEGAMMLTKLWIIWILFVLVLGAIANFASAEAYYVERGKVSIDIPQDAYAQMKIKALQQTTGSDVDLTFYNLLLKDKVAEKDLALIALCHARYPQTRGIASYILNHQDKKIDTLIQAEKLNLFFTAPYGKYKNNGLDD